MHKVCRNRLKMKKKVWDKKMYTNICHIGIFFLSSQQRLEIRINRLK